MGYIIGDIHNNIGELKKLLEKLDFKGNELLIFLGDYIGKKIHTKETLELLRILKNKYNCVFIKGDHEFVWERYLNQKELFRKEFLLNYGAVEALREYTDEAEELIEKDEIEVIKDFLKPYLNLIKDAKDYYLVGKYLAIHAGLLKEQLSQNPISFFEKNYFLREKDIDFDKLYLDKYIFVAGHTHFGKEPLILKGYINIDLGAGYDGYLGALDFENNKIIRSDGEIFNLF